MDYHCHQISDHTALEAITERQQPPHTKVLPTTNTPNGTRGDYRTAMADTSNQKCNQHAEIIVPPIDTVQLKEVSSTNRNIIRHQYYSFQRSGHHHAALQLQCLPNTMCCHCDLWFTGHSLSCKVTTSFTTAFNLFILVPIVHLMPYAP